MPMRSVRNRNRSMPYLTGVDSDNAERPSDHSTTLATLTSGLPGVTNALCLIVYLLVS